MATVPREAETIPLPYDLRIGVTGHRRIPDPTTMTAAIRRLLERVRIVLDPSPAVRLNWTVISPLATGADQIVAEAVLEFEGARLEAVTPFSVGEYRRDFPSNETAQAFESLLARAHIVRELPGLGHERNAAYSRVGEYVADRCELLIAVWDGKPAQGKGGTAEVVHYAAGHGRTVIWVNPLDLDAEPRLLGADDAGALVPRPFPTEASALSKEYVQQRAFVADSSERPSAIREEIHRLQRHFKQLHGLDELLYHFVRADLLARRYQKLRMRSVGAVLVLAGAGITVAVAQVTFFERLHWLALLEAAAMASVFAAWMISHRRKWHHKWLQDRYLAERLRATIFLALLDCPGLQVADDPLRYYRGPYRWISSVCAWVGDSMASKRGEAFAPRDSASLLRRWIDDQRSFHESTAGRVQNRLGLYRVLSISLFGLTFIMAILHALDAGRLVVFLALVLPVWAGVIHAAAVQFELERVHARSAGMARVLRDLAERAEQAQTASEVTAIARDATQLMSMEALEWWKLLSFQDVHLHL